MVRWASPKRLPEGCRSKVKSSQPNERATGRWFHLAVVRCFRGQAASATWQKDHAVGRYIARGWHYFREGPIGDIRQMKEAATEPASMVEPTQRFKGFSLIFDALPA